MNNIEKNHSTKCAYKNAGDQCDCDGYHTFAELYDHRITLFITLCKYVSRNGHPEVWRSRRHSDGSTMDGWFVMGISEKNGRQITYHLPGSEWDNAEFAETREYAPEFDGHTADDALNRLRQLL